VLDAQKMAFSGHFQKAQQGGFGDHPEVSYFKNLSKKGKFARSKNKNMRGRGGKKIWNNLTDII